MNKEANSTNTGARDVEYGSLSGGEGGKYNGVGLMEIADILSMQGDIFRLFRTI